MTFITAECLEWLTEQPDNSVDMTLGSPPYEDARLYGMEFRLKGQDWVDWMMPRVLQMVRVTKGPVFLVVEGRTQKFKYSATPILLMADLHRAGVCLRKPPAFKRNGIPGSGGPDWLRNDYEFIVACTSGGKLPWSNNTAMGHEPKCPPGGPPSHRTKNGERVGQKCTERQQDGTLKPRIYTPPKLANPGNVINCGAAGGGNMGSRLAHENEAPFPESLAEFLTRSFCPPEGTVLDPFSGSGTTCCVADRLGRKWVGVDCRESQTELANQRLTQRQESQ